MGRSKTAVLRERKRKILFAIMSKYGPTSTPGTMKARCRECFLAVAAVLPFAPGHARQKSDLIARDLLHRGHADDGWASLATGNLCCERTPLPVSDARVADDALSGGTMSETKVDALSAPMRDMGSVVCGAAGARSDGAKSRGGSSSGRTIFHKVFGWWFLIVAHEVCGGA